MSIRVCLHRESEFLNQNCATPEEARKLLGRISLALETFQLRDVVSIAVFTDCSGIEELNELFVPSNCPVERACV